MLAILPVAGLADRNPTAVASLVPVEFKSSTFGTGDTVAVTISSKGGPVAAY